MARALPAAGISRRGPVAGGSSWVGPPLALLCVIFFYPLSLLVTQALTGGGRSLTLAPVRTVFASALFAGALQHTIEIAVAATTGCVGLGFTIALILSFVPFPGARLVLLCHK